MSRLTLKIFAWFFLSLLLLAASSTLLTAWWINNERLTLESAQQREAEAAALALAEGGTAGLREWALRQANRGDGGPVFLLIDEWGDELLGRAVKDIDWPASETALPESEAGDYSWPAVLLALPPALPTLVSEDGERFQLLALSPSTETLTVQALARTAGPQVLLAILTLLLVSALLARSLTGPILQLERVAERLANGELDARAPIATSTRRDELGSLARTFDRMAERLMQSLRNRERLLQDISHELRSPLSRIRLAVGLQRQNPTATAPLERVDTEVDKLDRLIAQVLEVARLDAGTEWLRRDTLELGALVEPLIENARFEGAARHCGIRWEPSATPLLITGDADWTAAAIENVLRNALRFGATGSNVDVRLQGFPERIELTVSDQGIGVPTAELERIFEPFYRADPARAAESGGAGLGLAIANRVLKAQGGTITAHNRLGSVGQREGLAVTLSWPRHG